MDEVRTVPGPSPPLPLHLEHVPSSLGLIMSNKTNLATDYILLHLEDEGWNERQGRSSSGKAVCKCSSG